MSGAELARAYHDALVGPLLRRDLPAVPLVAGRFGAGSDVLGLDDEVSTDHDWGLRLTVLTDAPGVEEHLEARLPERFAGRPVRFATTWDPASATASRCCRWRSSSPAGSGSGPRGRWSVADWLALTGQSVLELLAGPVFADDEGRWARLRDRLAWYPDDLWRYLLACGWRQLEQELPLVARTGARGDDLGSRVVAARLADVVVRTGLLLDRAWAPYPKWTGTLFARSPSGRLARGPGRLPGRRRTAGEREAALCAALEELRERQREVGLPVAAAATVPFHDRESRGVPPSASALLLATVADPLVRALPVGRRGRWSSGSAPSTSWSTPVCAGPSRTP